MQQTETQPIDCPNATRSIPPMSAPASKLKVTTPSDREVVMTREFNAPARLVFDAWTKPELIRRWLLGPEGWTMPVCECDLRVGGKYRWVWRNADGREMGIGGTYREIERPTRIVWTEAFDDPWYPGEAIVTTELIEKDGKTLSVQTMLMRDKDARDVVLKSGMESGVEVSFARLDEIFAELA
jgi:uncharacterized protein YndB with AHSA1/START domain